MSNSSHVGKHVNATSVFLLTCRLHPDARSFCFFSLLVKVACQFCRHCKTTAQLSKKYKTYFGHPPKSSPGGWSLVDVFKIRDAVCFILFYFIFRTECAPLRAWIPLDLAALTGFGNVSESKIDSELVQIFTFPPPKKIQISTAYVQLASWYQVEGKALTLSSLSSMQSVTLPCLVGPQVYYRSLCFPLSCHSPSCATFTLASDVSAVWVAGGDWRELLSPRPFSCALLSLRSAAVRRGLCHNCCIYPERLRRVKPPKFTQRSAHFVWQEIYDDRQRHPLIFFVLKFVTNALIG